MSLASNSDSGYYSRFKNNKNMNWEKNSSNINEVIRTILKLFMFFLQEDFTRTKSTKSTQANKNKKDSIFMGIKNI